jgi:hypothetical protein
MCNATVLGPFAPQVAHTSRHERARRDPVRAALHPRYARQRSKICTMSGQLKSRVGIAVAFDNMSLLETLRLVC